MAFGDRFRCLLLTELGDCDRAAVLDRLAADATDHPKGWRMCHGTQELAEGFTDRWIRTHPELTMRAMPMLRYRQADRNIEPTIAGAMDVFHDDEDDLLCDWAVGFAQDIGEPGERPGAEWLERNRPLSRCWRVDGQAVAMARFGRMVRDSVAVSGVYTPPEHRRRGYASALVAALSTALAEERFRHRLLFTDAENPTSNHIYQDVGYRLIGSAVTIHFD